MDLLDRYLQAVRFWLPKSKRQEDILAELGEDLRSQIEARESELGRPLDKNEVSEILKRCGPPMVVGSRLGPNRYLIGPGIFPIYGFVLKMVLLWIQAPVFLFILGPINLAYANGDWGGAIVKTLSEAWTAGFIAAAIITLVFAIVERSPAQAAVACKWDPLKLPPLHKTERKVSPANAISQLIFGMFGLVWLLLLPQHPFLILGPAAAFLKAAPVWSTVYVPLVVLSFLSLLRFGLTLARPQWEWFPPLAELVQAILTMLVVNFLINAAGQAPNGNWHPYVMLMDAEKDSAQLIRLAAIVNVSILVSLVCSWIGIGIGLVVQLWRLFGFLRKRRVDRQPAPLQVR
jgi:hypothetical protein